MKFFITSGGTKVPIDDVRDITNMSKGTFGTKIATAALDAGHEVFQFYSGKNAFSFNFDYLENPVEFDQGTFLQKRNWCQKYNSMYQRQSFRNYDDYANNLPILLTSYKPDVIVLSAAVSDYITTPRQGKVRSSDELRIDLRPAEKIISKVKGWCPNAILVGFKLLVDVSEEELIEAAGKSIRDNGCDLVVANDFVTLKRGCHELILVDRNGHEKHKDNLPETIISRIEELRHDSHAKKKITGPVEF